MSYRFDKGWRRRELLTLAGSAAALSILPEPSSANGREWITKGPEFAALASFDQTMRDFMQARSISGGALAVTRNGKLVLARGYSYSDDNDDIVVQPTSLFRLASISKPITASAVLRLVQDGLLALSDRLTDLLALQPPAGQSLDPQLSEITVQRLLQHLGGWDRDLEFDPMFRDYQIADELALALPIAKADIIAFMSGRALQHTPGSTYAYSNYGYGLLGAIVEAVSGQSYQEYVRQAVLTPLQLVAPELGRTLPEHRLPGEVKYHSSYAGPSVFDASAQAQGPYGRFNIENMDAHGGWVWSAVDLARFAATFDDPETSPVLNRQMTDIMYGLPENIAAEDYVAGAFYYGCGWVVRDWGAGVRNTWHSGSLDGTYTLVVRRSDGVNWSVLFNQRDDYSGLSYGEIDGQMHRAANAVEDWPQHDLFERFLGDSVFSNGFEASTEAPEARRQP